MDVQQQQEQNNTTTQPSQSSIQLIIIKKNKRIKYYHRCVVNVKQHELWIKPDVENGSSTFKVNINDDFVKFEYAIYCPNTSNSFGFAFIFDHRRHCNYVFETLQRKQAQNGYKVTQISNEEIVQMFIKPLIKELRYYSSLEFDFIYFILKFLRSLNTGLKQRLADSIIDTGIEQGLLDRVLIGVDLSTLSKRPKLVVQEESREGEDGTIKQPEFSSSLPPPRRVTFSDDKTEAIDKGESSSNDKELETYDKWQADKRNNKSKLKNRLRKRRANQDESNSSDGDGKFDNGRPRKIRRKRKPASKKSEPTPSHLDEIIHAQYFKLISYIQNGISKSRLFIFPTAARHQCYEYFFDFNRQIYICCGCNNIKRCTHATIAKDSNGEDYVQCLKTDHLCNLRPFKPDKYKTDFIIKKPNYEFVKDNELLLYTSTDKKSFYSMTYDAHQKLYICLKCWVKKNYIQACVCYDDAGEQYISVRNRKHICSKMNYLVSDEMGESATLPSYQHVVRNLNKISKKLAKK